MYFISVSVAHTKILVRQTKTKMPEGSSRAGLNNIKYNVEFAEIYKVKNLFITHMSQIFVLYIFLFSHPPN